MSPAGLMNYIRGNIGHAEHLLLRGSALNLMGGGNLRMLASLFQSVLNALDLVQRQMLGEVLREKQIQGPTQRHAQLFFEARQFHEINRSPQPPRHKAGHVKAEDVGHSGASSDDRELTKGRERK